MLSLGSILLCKGECKNGNQFFKKRHRKNVTPHSILQKESQEQSHNSIRHLMQVALLQDVILLLGILIMCPSILFVDICWPIFLLGQQILILVLLLLYSLYHLVFHVSSINIWFWFSFKIYILYSNDGFVLFCFFNNKKYC